MDQTRKSREFSFENDIFDKIDIRALLYLLWINKWLVGVIAGVCLVLGIAYSHMKVPLYSSNILIQVDNKNSGLFSSDKDIPGLFGSKPTSVAEVQSALIKSRYVLEPVIERLKLDISVAPVRFPIFGDWYARKHNDILNKPWWGASRYSWGNELCEVSLFKVPFSQENKRFILIAGPENHYELYDSMQHFILKGEVGKFVKTEIPGKGMFALQIDKLEAAPNTNFYIIKSSIQKIVAGLSGGIKINDLSEEMQLRNDTGILKISMIGAQPDAIISILNAVAQIAVEKNSRKKSEEATQTLNFINQELPRVRQSLHQAETSLNQYLAREHMLDLASESKLLLGEIGDTYKKLNAVKITKKAALQKYTSYHPFIIELIHKEKAIQSELDALQRKVSQLPIRDQTAVRLMRDVRIKSHLYLLMLNKIQTLEVIKGSVISDVNILGFADYPDEPLPAGTFKITIFSLLLGVLLGVSLVYLQRILNRKLSDPNLVEAKFGLTNLAIVPYSEKQGKLLTQPTDKVTKNRISLLAQFDSRDLSIEALRSLRTSSQFSIGDAANNIVTILGISPGVGKSFVSANFAYLHADVGKKVLLIDGDIRKGHLKDYFNAGRASGLTEVLCGNISFEEALIRNPVPNLDFLSTGCYPPNPSELLMGPQFKAFLDKVSSLYDLIIFDTAPILAVTDALVIAHHAGTNFLVLASNAHEVSEIELALKKFKANHVHINGVVFNFSKGDTGIYRYGQTFKYQYDYSG